ncbi:splicing factor u2af large subunit, putative [Entamoeba invadens IP1]|uniref:Splicing factor u2af large subunit, putative n=1 Tax=Entamoeba invadens IP1 TaxID=370355 RepID=A0A0A1TV81_ENTIV|nr:splicing factor u2af large subunit, putative [Entamoeba invadens IP1]ELP84237.1 splicing factor u2af large subunit, putative [Entamoeba invadens IP1]|eukprot:XP_004183583.1 splicing factor u2af large subunit, putative [Entamoeba invadens IP1]
MSGRGPRRHRSSSRQSRHESYSDRRDDYNDRDYYRERRDYHERHRDRYESHYDNRPRDRYDSPKRRYYDKEDRSPPRHDERRKARSPSLSPLGKKIKSRWDEQPVADASLLQQQLNVHQEKGSRRVYVGNINTTTTEQDIVEAFNDAMRRGDYVDKNDKSDIIVSTEVNYEKSYAFIEFRTFDQAVKALSLDGLTIKGASVKVRRPKDFNPVLPFISSLSQLMEVGTTKPRDGVMYMGNIPLQMSDEQIQKKLENLNPLKKYVVVRDPSLGAPQGKCYCLFEYQNPEYKDKVLAFNGIILGGDKIEVCSGLEGFKHFPTAALNELCMKMFPQRTDIITATLLNSSVGYSDVFERVLHNSEDLSQYECTRVIVLFNMFFPEDLNNEQRYIELVDDIREACIAYGEVISISIPRPTETNKRPSGIGRAFVEFKDVEMAKTCWREIVKRRYDNRQIVAGFYSESKYNSRSFGYVTEEKEDEEERVEKAEKNEQPTTDLNKEVPKQDDLFVPTQNSLNLMEEEKKEAKDEKIEEHEDFSPTEKMEEDLKNVESVIKTDLCHMKQDSPKVLEDNVQIEEITSEKHETKMVEECKQESQGPNELCVNHHEEDEGDAFEAINDFIQSPKK